MQGSVPGDQHEAQARVLYGSLAFPFVPERRGWLMFAGSHTVYTRPDFSMIHYPRNLSPSMLLVSVSSRITPPWRRLWYDVAERRLTGQLLPSVLLEWQDESATLPVIEFRLFGQLVQSGGASKSGLE